MQQIGLFGGTFDPIHLGHLNLAIGLFEKHHLDEVWFIPAKWNPIKNQQAVASFAHRLAMVKAAIKPLPTFKVVEIEGEREGVSYTYETIEQLKKSVRDDQQFYFMMSDETAHAFYRWHMPEGIINSVPLLVGSRYDRSLPDFEGGKKIREALKENWTLLPMFEISATEIRNRLAQGLFIGHLVPEKVLDYITKYQLYCNG